PAGACRGRPGLVCHARWLRRRRGGRHPARSQRAAAPVAGALAFLDRLRTDGQGNARGEQ
ncbi:MAG: hypothetical protein OXF27_13315, partial [Acidobacteria bacterium]|nr:hypothetical protein [Acidobacteriota bacterium]